MTDDLKSSETDPMDAAFQSESRAFKAMCFWGGLIWIGISAGFVCWFWQAHQVKALVASGGTVRELEILKASWIGHLDVIATPTTVCLFPFGIWFSRWLRPIRKRRRAE